MTKAPIRRAQRRLLAFICGAYEFRRDYTWHAPTYYERASYEQGRELAHRLTFRRFDA